LIARLDRIPVWSPPGLFIGIRALGFIELEPNRNDSGFNLGNKIPKASRRLSGFRSFG
jgi:hypothetical protein